MFGDTVNTASRIQTSGVTNRIHVSSVLASIVRHLPACDAYVLEKRDDLIDTTTSSTKEIMMQTYWLDSSSYIDIDELYIETFRFIEKYVTEFTTERPELLSIIAETLCDSSTSSSISSSEEAPGRNNSKLRSNKSFPMFHVPANDMLESTSSLSTSSLSPLNKLRDDMRYDYTTLCAYDYDVCSIQIDDYVGLKKRIQCIFEGLFDLSSINVDERVLYTFIRRVSRSYRPVAYHNFFHAFCVVQFGAALVVQCQLVEDLPKKELFCLLICALIHDIGNHNNVTTTTNTIIIITTIIIKDHPGNNNTFEIATQSRLSILYNDISVLENHHIGTTTTTTSTTTTTTTNNNNNNNNNNTITNTTTT